MVRCSSEFKQWAPRLFVEWEPVGSRYLLEGIETEFRATPEFGRLRDRVIEFCGPFRACMDDPANRDWPAERDVYESACKDIPDYRLCMDRTTNCSVAPE